MDSVLQMSFDVAVVGGGPAGIAAAATAANAGCKVVLLDDNPAPGGQIWRRGTSASQPPEGGHWLAQLEKTRVRVIAGARALHAEESILQAETDQALLKISYRKLILATGARELFLPFPGWTLRNVLGAGGLQALVKSGLPIEGKRIVVAGTGPLLLAVAAYLSKHGAKVLLICEQATLAALANFGLATSRFPKKFKEAIQLRFASRKAKYLTGSWPIAAHGKDVLESLTISERGRLREVQCDYLACGFHLVPNAELAQMLGCHLQEGFVRVDEFQRTSQPNILCAGEPTGIGGMELSIVEGRIAGCVAANSQEDAKQLFAERARYRKLSAAMKKAFRLRPELTRLAKPETLLCRCEDVPFGRVRSSASWKEAKLHTRCGMGPCQGRVCGAAAAFLFGWNVESRRPPVYPARCSSLAAFVSVPAEQHVNGGTR